MRSRWGVLAASLAVAASIVVGAVPASAHATLLDTSPGVGALLDTPPGEVSVTFNEPVRSDATSIVVIDEAGNAVGGPATAEGATVSATMPSDATGWHAVSWHAISTDGHPISGAWTFRIGEGAGAAPDELVEQARAGLDASAGVRIGWTVAQWSSTIAAMVVVGSLFAMAITQGVESQRRLALVTIGLGVVASGLGAGLNGAHAGPSVGWFHGPASDVYVARATLLALVGIILAFPADRPSRAIWSHLPGGLISTAALIAPVGSGHAAAESGVATIAVMAHLALAGCWLGAIPAVLLGVRAGDEPGRTVLTRFSRAAFPIFLAILVFGAIGAWVLSGGPGQIAQDWGVILILKIALVLMAVLAGAWNRFNVIPRFSDLPRRETTAPLVFEIVALVAVVSASIALTHNGPPQEVEPSGPIVVESTSDGSDDEALRVQVVIDPGRTGTNDIHVYVTDRIDDLGLTGTWDLHVTVRPDPFSLFEVDEAVDVRP
ncbi:MAG: copper resistance protein CopC/CopD [Acidimicrobiia bacterium]|nr:copper resistance protein CopC/CopD [Acidimicrobiia bacterium]